MSQSEESARLVVRIARARSELQAIHSGLRGAGATKAEERVVLRIIDDLGTLEREVTWLGVGAKQRA